MIEAYVLIDAKLGQATDVVHELAALAGVRDVTLVAGVYDVIARIEVPDAHAMERLTVQRIPQVGGVLTTRVCPLARRGVPLGREHRAMAAA